MFVREHPTALPIIGFGTVLSIEGFNEKYIGDMKVGDRVLLKTDSHSDDYTKGGVYVLPILSIAGGTRRTLSHRQAP